MKLKTIIVVTLITSQLSTVSLADTTTVDDIYNTHNQKLIIPIVQVDGKRFSTQLNFSDLQFEENTTSFTDVTINSLRPLYDSTKIMVDKGFNQPIAQKLKKLLNRHINEFYKPGAIIRVDIAGKVWRGVMGKKRVNGEALNFSDRHRIGSLTKTFISNVILQLVKDGGIKLDATIDQYIPEVNIHNKDKITVRHLITHKTGLYNYVISASIQNSIKNTPLRIFTPEELIAIANEQPIVHEPGKDYAYSNTGLILAGLIIESVTGKKVEDVVYKRIFKPLGLHRTEFPKDPSIQSNYMHGHSDYNNDGILDSTEIVSYLDPSVSWAAGAIVSNIPDLSRWMKTYIDGGLLNNKLQQQMLSDCFLSMPKMGISYCMGVVKITWPFNSTDENNGWWGHLGQIEGYDVSIFRNPSKNITVSILNNNYYLGTPEEFGSMTAIFAILNILEPLTDASLPMIE